MWILYALALLPAGVSAYFWATSKKVVWWEALIGAAVGFVFAGLVHWVSVAAMTRDTETWSGRVVAARFRPYWHASWTEIETYTDADGNLQTRVVHRSRSYPDAWYARVSYDANQRGWEEYGISKGWYNSILKEFGTTQRKLRASRIHWDRGSRHDWISQKNETGVILPATKRMSFTNRTLAAESLFSYAEVPEGTPVYEYPKNKRWSISDRLLGAAKNAINIRDWDALNAQLGPAHKVNLILVGFDSPNSNLGQQQEAEWKGGKKNDLVLCYGGLAESGGNPSWSYVFGWTEREVVKRNLETLLISNPINRDILPKIAEEVGQNYEIKDWSKFDYLPIEPPWWSYLVMLILTGVAGYFFWWWAHQNMEDKAYTVS